MQKINFLILATLVALAAHSSAQISAGVFDYANSCLASAACEKIEAEGDWGFIKGQLLLPDEILKQNPKTFLEVPGTWHGQRFSPFAKEWSEAIGVGTYFLKLKNFKPIQGGIHAGIAFSRVFTASKVFLTQIETGKTKVLADEGWNMEQPLKSKGSVKDFILPLNHFHESGEYLLTLHVANNVHAKAGIRSVPVIGDVSQLQDEKNRELITKSVIVGAIFIIAIYHFLIHMQRRNDWSSFWIGFECLMLGVFVTLRSGLVERIYVRQL